MKTLTTMLILFVSTFITSTVMANTVTLDSAIGDREVVNVELLRPTPVHTPTLEPTSTPTPVPPSGNLLVNPGFADDHGECFSPIVTHQITGWNHVNFGFGGIQQNFPKNQEWSVCAARTKGALHGPGQGAIPEGETGRLWQVVAIPSYSEIIFKDARMEHEDGTVIHRVYGCVDADGNDCALIAETNATIPQVTNKDTCDAYVQIITINTRGGVSRIEYADPNFGCTSNLPAPVSFTASFAQYSYLKVEVEVDPLPNGQGQSGYKAGWWSLEVN